MQTPRKPSQCFSGPFCSGKNLGNNTSWMIWVLFQPTLEAALVDSTAKLGVLGIITPVTHLFSAIYRGLIYNSIYNGSAWLPTYPTSYLQILGALVSCGTWRYKEQ